MFNDTTYLVSTQSETALQPHNAILISPRGQRIHVNITPEAAVVWTRCGFRIEWLRVAREVA